LQDGITILFSATVNFEPTHGLSLRIIDIDPVFSLGELEREKQESIERLTSEGIFLKNKQLQLPLLPQRIAVISVETSKGYADYLKIIHQNPWKYKLLNVLFPAVLQGERSVDSILWQLNRIKKVNHYFDAVAIIRGGGGDVGLSSYNNYHLARAVALFPIPVFTGIGHATNETVTEMVAFQNAITPTELADFLIQKFHNFSVPVKNAERIIVERSTQILKNEQSKLYHSVRFIKSLTLNQLLKKRNGLDTHSRALVVQATLTMQSTKTNLASGIASLQQSLSNFIEAGSEKIAEIQKHISLLDPVNILKRGFSITIANGKSVKSYDELSKGDIITTRFADGEITSEVKDKRNER
jgi:exodeoxyribonuclease VII large subunit